MKAYANPAKRKKTPAIITPVIKQQELALTAVHGELGRAAPAGQNAATAAQRARKEILP